jgi:Protein of unknown function (DUF4242)
VVGRLQSAIRPEPRIDNVGVAALHTTDQSRGRFISALHALLWHAVATIAARVHFSPVAVQGAPPMRRYVIERDIPGASQMTDAQLRAASATSNAALADLGAGIQWVQSHVTNDKIYCVYLAENEAVVHEHARRAGLPANKVSEVARIIDPLTANG